MSEESKHNEEPLLKKPRHVPSSGEVAFTSGQRGKGLDVANIRTVARQRTSVARFNPIPEKKTSKHSTLNADEKNASEKVHSTGLGEGTPLGDIPNVAFMLKKITGTHDLCPAFHRVLYGSIGKAFQRKKNIKAFQGFVFSSQLTREKVTGRLLDKKWTVAALKDLCQLLDVDRSGDKATLVERIVTFLMKPAANSSNPSKEDIAVKKGEKAAKKKERLLKKKKTKTKSSKKTDGKKRSLSAFFLFSKDQRPMIKKEFPDYGITDVARELGKQWKVLSEDKRKEYQIKAQKAKEKLALGVQQPDESEESMESHAEEENEDEGDEGEEEEEEDEEELVTASTAAAAEKNAAENSEEADE